MDFGEIFRVLRRRWFVAIPALLLTVVATVGMFVVWPTTYQSQVQLTLLSSRSVAAQQGNDGNPYLDFTTGLDAVVDILGRNLSSDQAINQLAARGVTDSYTAGIAINAQGPFLAIIVTGKNRAEIAQSMPVIVTYARQRLARMQNASAAPKGSLIQAVLIAPPSRPTPVLKTKVEVVAAVAVAGLVGSLLLCFIVDSILSKRAERRSEADRDSQTRRGPRPDGWPEADQDSQTRRGPRPDSRPEADRDSQTRRGPKPPVWPEKVPAPPARTR